MWDKLKEKLFGREDTPEIIQNGKIKLHGEIYVITSMVLNKGIRQSLTVVAVPLTEWRNNDGQRVQKGNTKANKGKNAK